MKEKNERKESIDSENTGKADIIALLGLLAISLGITILSILGAME